MDRWKPLKHSHPLLRLSFSIMQYYNFAHHFRFLLLPDVPTILYAFVAEESFASPLFSFLMC